MAKETRTPTSYLSDDWGLAKGGDPESDGGIPFREDMPPEPGRGYGKGDRAVGGYGHSEEVKYDPGASRWDLSGDDLARGYSKPGDDAGEPGSASNPQGIPSSNEWNRGADFSRRDFAGEEGPDVGNGRDGKSRENIG
jgi:hypothetical protein